MSAAALVTFWLYFGDQPLTAVRLPKDATIMQVREKAIEETSKFGLCDRPYETPHERINKIRMASIRLHAPDLH